MIKIKLRRQKFLQRLILITTLVVLVGLIASYYLLVNPIDPFQIQSNLNGIGPTPSYLSLVNQPANFVGVITEIGPQRIQLLRDDNSQVILTLQPNIPIYQVISLKDQTPQVTIRNIDSLNVGMTLAVYTQNQNITAIFLADDTPTTNP